jgi:hypothetical protein
MGKGIISLSLPRPPLSAFHTHVQSDSTGYSTMVMVTCFKYVLDTSDGRREKLTCAAPRCLPVTDHLPFLRRGWKWPEVFSRGRGTKLALWLAACAREQRRLDAPSARGSWWEVKDQQLSGKQESAHTHTHALAPRRNLMNRLLNAAAVDSSGRCCSGCWCRWSRTDGRRRGGRCRAGGSGGGHSHVWSHRGMGDRKGMGQIQPIARPLARTPYIHTSTQTHKHTNTQAHKHTSTHTHTHTHTHKHTHTSTHKHTHTHIHKHTHTHTPKSAYRQRVPDLLGTLKNRSGRA